MPRPPDYFTEHRIASKVEPEIQSAVLSAIKEAERHVSMSVLVAGVDPLQAFDFTAIEDEWSLLFVSVFEKTIQEAADTQVENLPDDVFKGRLQDLLTRFRFQFNINDPTTQSWIRSNAGQLVRTLIEHTKEAIRVVFRRPDDSHEDFFIIAQVAFIGVFVHDDHFLRSLRLKSQTTYY